MIGIDPNAQGTSFGGALMRHALVRYDEEGALADLESSNPRNISLYERHGFEVMGEIQIGAAPVVTPMLRRPRGLAPAPRVVCELIFPSSERMNLPGQ